MIVTCQTLCGQIFEENEKEIQVKSLSNETNQTQGYRAYFLGWTFSLSSDFARFQIPMPFGLYFPSIY